MTLTMILSYGKPVKSGRKILLAMVRRPARLFVI